MVWSINCKFYCLSVLVLEIFIQITIYCSNNILTYDKNKRIYLINLTRFLYSSISLRGGLYPCRTWNLAWAICKKHGLSFSSVYDRTGYKAVLCSLFRPISCCNLFISCCKFVYCLCRTWFPISEKNLVFVLVYVSFWSRVSLVTFFIDFFLYICIVFL